MENQFILYVKHTNFIKENRLLKEAISSSKFNAFLAFEKILGQGNEALYCLEIHPSDLIRLKRFLDEKFGFTSIHLYEYRAW